MNALLNKRYEVQGELAATTLNTVLLAVDQETTNKCIIKVPNKGYCTSEQHSQLCWHLANERDVLRKLAHERIRAPRVVAFFHVSGQPHLVIRFVPGDNLQTIHDRGKLPSDMALVVLIEICAVLALVHELGFCHGDVKPPNVIVRPDGHAVLIDWGSALPLNLDAPPRSYSFTRDYASIEQMQGSVRATNDIFALGQTLNVLIPYASPRVQRVINAATAPLEQRYQHVSHVRVALQRLQVMEQFVKPLGATVLRL